ncbi:tRNA-intron endonuclease catalytic domain-like protein [Boletus edulis]|nr:tRNA-intron endonuclease catalytic domain-like protein [Boletus edulis]
MASNRLIPLRVSNKKAYVWDIDGETKGPHIATHSRPSDIATLRSSHRLCGVLTGTLPHLSQQNVFLGVPLLLMPEEVVLLVEKGLAILVDDQNAHHDPSAAEMEKWDSERLRGVEEQLALAEEHDAREALHPDRGMSEKAILKRKEREERKARGKANAHDPDQGVSTPVITESVPDPVESSRITPSHSPGATPARNLATSYTVHVPGASSTFEWYAPSIHSFTTLAAARDAGMWDYPETPAQRARCAVFRDLWEQGYFMGGGFKFGGEYLVYPGDPLRYHSHFVASVIESPAAPLRPMEIIAHGRLGTGTKKAHLLCEWSEEKKTVTYYSIEWAGFG